MSRLKTLLATTVATTLSACAVAAMQQPADPATAGPAEPAECAALRAQLQSIHCDSKPQADRDDCADHAIELRREMHQRGCAN